MNPGEALTWLDLYLKAFGVLGTVWKAGGWLLKRRAAAREAEKEGPVQPKMQ